MTNLKSEVSMKTINLDHFLHLPVKIHSSVSDLNIYYHLVKCVKIFQDVPKLFNLYVLDKIQKFPRAFVNPGMKYFSLPHEIFLLWC